jgi:tetratricopeptide (TPR) repeat protein
MLLIATKFFRNAVFLLLHTLGSGLFGQQAMEDRKIEADLTRSALDHIYNLQFSESEKSIRQLEKAGKTHIVYFLKALQTYWKYMPLKKGTEEYILYEHYLISSVKQADELYMKDQHKDVEGIFFSFASYGKLAVFYADEGSVMKAVSYASKAYFSLKKGFELKDDFAEFYFTTALYNYFREKYPENNPMYKPFTWFFEKGNKNLGIDQLIFASDRALFTKAEANYYLFHINLRYEKNPSSAVKYAKTLHEVYPENPLFQAYYCESLLFDKKFEVAERLIENLQSVDQPFYRILTYLFQGMLLEKYRPNFKEAEKHYLKALELADSYNFDVNYYKSLAWAGMARLADREGDKDKARDHYSKAMKLAPYDIVTDEAKAYLQSRKNAREQAKIR